MEFSPKPSAVFILFFTLGGAGWPMAPMKEDTPAVSAPSQPK
jgi:hypothetical protein